MLRFIALQDVADFLAGCVACSMLAFGWRTTGEFIAAAIGVVGLSILTPLDAEAATKGVVRRQERRYRRATRRYTRRTNRYNRRKAARGM